MHSSRFFFFFHFARWLENAIKSDPNLAHVGVHSIRQTQAHTNDFEINWYNDMSLCLAVVWSENLALWFKALHFVWHVMWSWTCQGKINLLFLLCFMYVQCLCVAMGYFKRQWKRVAGVTGSESTYVTEHRQLLNGQKALIGCAAAVSVDTECVRFRKTGVGGRVHISGFSYSLSLSLSLSLPSLLGS